MNLYENHQFVVRFPPIEYEEEQMLFGHEFSIDRTQNRALSETDVLNLLLAARPNFLGPYTEVARKILAEIGTEPEKSAPKSGPSST